MVGLISVLFMLSRRTPGDEPPEPGIGTARRLYYYGVGFILLALAASGATTLLAVLVDALGGDEGISSREGTVAIGAALTIVAAPAWLWLWSRARLSLRGYPAEAWSQSRKLYHYAVLGITAAVAATGTVSLLEWAFRAEDFSGLKVAVPIVMAAIWTLHYRTESTEGQPTAFARTLRRIYIYASAGYGLALLATGLGGVVYRALLEAYDAVAANQLLAPSSGNLWDSTMQRSLALSIAGLAWWGWHWVGLGRDDKGSHIRHTYLHLFAVAGGVATTIVSLAIVLFHVVEWAAGAPAALSAAARFVILPGAVAGLLIGAALWGYHRAVLQQEPHRDSSRMFGASAGTEPAGGPGVIYRYLVSAAGLGAVAVGLVYLTGVVIGTLIPEAGDPIAGPEWWKRPMSIGVTLLIIGTPLWAYFWKGLQRRAGMGPLEERTTLPRRAYMYFVFAAALLAAVGGLAAVLYVVLKDMLSGGTGLEALQAGKWSIGVFGTAVILGIYHRLVLKEDRAARLVIEAQEAMGSAPTPKQVMALAGAEAAPLVRRIETRLRRRIAVWRLLSDDAGPTIEETDLDRLEHDIHVAPGDRVILLIDSDGVRVVPYEPL